MECLKGEFEYFAPKPFVTQVERSFYREYTPISALQNQAAILFMVPYSDQIYLHLTRSFLYVRAKITNATGGDVTDTTEIGPINQPIHSMFSNIDVELGGKMISDPNGLYPYRAYIESLLIYTKDAQESHMLSSLWYNDTRSRMDVAIILGSGATNLRLRSRTTQFSANPETKMCARLHLDIFHHRRAIPQNCNLILKLSPGKMPFS